MQLHRRDAVALALAFLLVLVAAWLRPGATDLAFLAWGAVVGAALGVAVHRGWMGEDWRDAGIVLGVGVAIPIMQLAWGVFFTPLLFALPAIAMLPLAHLLAERHHDPHRRQALFVAAAGFAAVAVLASVQPLPFGAFAINRLLPAVLASLVPLVPALGLALNDGRSETISTAADRWTALAFGVTPGAAMTVIVRGEPDPLLFVGWLGVLVVWRRFGSGQLVRVAERSQQQRDLAVAAAEAERARLAADLHDDALQELTGLVRRFDEAGDADGAEMARGVAERLRAICSDLRLPLLDDLGAGPAIEWLVARVQPLAEGPISLERDDPKRPPPDVELAVFRVAQEALANAVRHGKPPISVRFRSTDDAVSLTVDDSGSGIEPDAAEQALRSGHFGLATMQQRAEQIGALLDVRRWPSGGTHVAFEWRAR